MSGIIENFKKGIHALETSSSEESILFGFIKLKYEIQKKNFYAMLVYNIILGFCLNGVELIQHNSLLSMNYFGFTAHEAAQHNSFIILLDLFTKVIVSPIYGGLCDRIGRQKLAIGGCSLVVLSFFIFIPSGYPDSSLTQCYIARIINGNGITMLSVLPFVADYIDHDSKGRAVGVSALLMATGFALSTSIVSMFHDHENDISMTYIVFAILILLLAAPCCWFLKEGNQYYKIAVTSPDKHIDVDDDIITNLQETSIKPSKKTIVIQACKSRPWIIVAYIFAFVNGICLAISHQNLNLYAQSFDLDQLTGKQLGSSIVLQSNIASILSSLIVGAALDFIQPIYVASFGFGLNILGFLCISVVDHPENFSLTLIAVSFGMAFAVSQILANYLGFKHYPTSMRGFFFSISNICNLVGIILTTVVGGLLFNSGDRNWPFYIAGLCSLMALCGFVYVYLEKIIPTKRKIQNKQELNLSLLYTSIQTPQNEVPLEVDDTKLGFDD